MWIKHGARAALNAVILYVITGCSSGYDRPQKEHTFTGNLTDEQRSQANYNKRVRDRIVKEEKAMQFQRLSVKIAKLSSDAPYAGLGFLPNNTTAYTVQRDARATIFSPQGGLTPLDQLAKRVDRAQLAAPRSNRILGLSAHGTQAVWNAGNLSQQLVLRPQKSTFGRVKMFDSEPVSGGRYLVTASEGGLMERWSLSSGNRVSAVKFSAYQPRQIARNISVNRVIFGTNDGQVRIWRGGHGSDFQYSHSGPILELVCIPKRNLIASVGKDGRIILFDMMKRQIVLSRQFTKADYQLVVSKDERRIIASPAVGAPIAIDLQTFKASFVRHVPTNITTKVEFGASSDFAISQHGGSGMMFWNLSRAKPLTYKLAPQARGKPMDFSVSEYANVAAILTNKDFIEYWDIGTKKYLGPAFRSRNAGIARFEISADANWLLVGLTDGRIIRLRVSYGEDAPVDLE